jgi:superfamily II DNA helicase RecQ
VLKFASA